MKRLVCLPLVWLCIVAWSQPSIDKKIRDNIASNKIKSQTSWEYKYNGDKAEAAGIKTSVSLYNTSGDIIMVTTYNPKGLVLNVEKYAYDMAGNKVEYSRYTGGNEDQVAYQKISKYDSRNNLIEEKGYDGVESFNISYIYNGQDNLLEIKYHRSGILKERRVFSKEEQKTHVSIYNPAGKMISRLLLKYDGKDNLLEETVYGINKDIIERKTFDYDDKKKLKAESRYKLNKMTLRTTYNYTGAGDLAEIMEESHESGKFIKKSYSYDAKGNMVEIKWRRRANEDFNSITYIYDAKGVCTQSETYYPATSFRTLTKYTYEFY
ncbi:MAG: hypothetical protein JW973_10630 [Bacteroidales bacterium]|nr:hypothetical protein [Bacteroidales bacterium]